MGTDNTELTAERFYFIDSHGDEAFVSAADHERVIEGIKEAVRDAQIRVGASANCYNEPKEAQSAADYVARAIFAVLEPMPAPAAEIVDEVQHRMDQVVETAVEWHQAGREGGEWFDAAEKLGAAIESLLELRTIEAQQQ